MFNRAAKLILYNADGTFKPDIFDNQVSGSSNLTKVSTAAHCFGRATRFAK
jgi:hypothetical protein